MQLIVVREAGEQSAEGRIGLFRYALSTAPLHDVILDGLHHLWGCRPGDEPAGPIDWTVPADALWALPESWRAGLAVAPDHTVFYNGSLHVDTQGWENRRQDSWFAIANGRFGAHVNHAVLGRLLRATPAEIVAVTAAPHLRASQERLRLTQDNKVVGYRRLYADSMSPMPVPDDWPHFLLVRRQAVDVALGSGLLSSFADWVGKCRDAGLKLQGVAVAGSACDLESPQGLLSVCQVALHHRPRPEATVGVADRRQEPLPVEGKGISPQSHRIGPVLLGKDVVVEAGAVVVGPTVLCDGCTIGGHAVVDSAIVGAGVLVAPDQTLGSCVVTASGRSAAAEESAAPRRRSLPEHVCPRDSGVFRTWPRFSYARCFKRIADVVAAVVVLILFAPVIPVIALAVKLSSPGPVFFGDKRQGLQGQSFYCVKFRTMRQGADKMQDKLRFVSEVDGPQFKMADDPRITTVGRFLRETYLDEIPQFFNVLCGQMSVVGPRPSPEAENTLCPSWRDARLSVRPGITGLWQVRRTREAGKDFQEWILYDTRYVRDFSFGLDLWICWRTFTRMVENFVSQF
jgi:lipopolysaccharide/colanic/teichoic acid biosynthesis glycosyltransferase